MPLPPGNHTGRDDEGYPYFVCPYCKLVERTYRTSDTIHDAEIALKIHIHSYHRDDK